MKNHKKTQEQLIKELADMRRRVAELERSEVEHKRTEAALKESESRLATIFKYDPTGIILVNSKTRTIHDVNQAAVEITGCPKEDLVGRICHSFFCPSEVGHCPALDLGQEMDRSERVLIRADGKPLLILKTAVPIKINGEEYLLESFIDIAERKQAVDALKVGEIKYRTLLENLPQKIFLKDKNLVYISCNENYARDLKIKPEEIAGKTDYDFYYKDLAEKYVADDKRTMDSGKIEEIEEKYIQDGREMFVHTVKTPVKDEKNNIIGILGIFWDITDRKRAEEALKESFERLRKATDATVDAIVKAVEMRDPYTAGHQRRVANLAAAIATGMGLSSRQIDGIRMAGVIHDLGKISIPAEILSMPRRLSEMEFNLVKTHAVTGYDMLKDIDFGYPVAQIVLQHHEKLDGSGYPQGLKDGEILLEARILAVADVVEAMASHRPYRPALGIDKTLEEISRNKGTTYDTEAVEACLKLFKEKGFKLKE